MGMYANLDARTLREMYRREKGSWEYESMNRRYDKECSSCITFKNEEEMNEYYNTSK